MLLMNDNEKWWRYNENLLKKLLFLLLINEIERTYENILCEEFKNQGAIYLNVERLYMFIILTNQYNNWKTQLETINICTYNIWKKS